MADEPKTITVPVSELLHVPVSELQIVGGDARTPPSAPAPDYGFGNRYGTTTPKGLGFLGLLKRPDGSAVMSEYSIGVNINGKETEIPTLVPTLTRAEVQAILTSKEGQPVPPSVREKATSFARQRIAAGLDPFARTGEQQTQLFPDLARAETPGVRPPAPTTYDQNAFRPVGVPARGRGTQLNIADYQKAVTAATTPLLPETGHPAIDYTVRPFTSPLGLATAGGPIVAAGAEAALASGAVAGARAAATGAVHLAVGTAAEEGMNKALQSAGLPAPVARAMSIAATVWAVKNGYLAPKGTGGRSASAPAEARTPSYSAGQPRGVARSPEFFTGETPPQATAPPPLRTSGAFAEPTATATAPPPLRTSGAFAEPPAVAAGPRPSIPPLRTSGAFAEPEPSPSSPAKPAAIPKSGAPRGADQWTTQAERVDQLEAALPRLSERDHEFVNSLITQSRAGRTLTSSQMDWVKEFIRRGSPGSHISDHLAAAKE